MQLLELCDEQEGGQHVLANPLTELGKRLEETDSLRLSQINGGNSIRGKKPKYIEYIN
jgi:hypothetical protein